MEDRFKKIKRKRIFAFIFDFVFILMLLFSINGLVGMVFKIDSPLYQSSMLTFMLIVGSPYLYFGELIFKNTFGKYLFGIEVVNKSDLSRPTTASFIKRGLIKIIWPLEAIVLLFNKNKVRLGDLWAKTIVVNKEVNKINPLGRGVMGGGTIVILYFSFSTFMGLAVKNSDYYQISENYLQTNMQAEISGLPKESIQNGHLVSLLVPILIDGQSSHAIICLEKIDTTWSVYHSEFLKTHTGRTFEFNLESVRYEEFFDNEKLSVEGAFLDKKKEGTFNFFYESGAIKSTRVYHNNIRIGKMTDWYENGELERIVNWKQGKQHGLFEEWYENGQKAIEMNWVEGEREGLYRNWCENGQLTDAIQYLTGKKDGEAKGYYCDGSIKYQGAYKNGKPIGLYNNWYANGQLEEQGTNLESGLEGEVNGYYENGNMRLRYNFIAGKKNGECTNFDSLGKAINTEVYLTDSLVSTVVF